MIISTARRFSTTPKVFHDIKKVTIIGGGLMGSGIAQVTAKAKIQVCLVDTNEKALANATSTIESSLKRIAKKMKDDEAEKQIVDGTMSYISTSTDVKEGVYGADLVIEAIVENIDAKLKLFEQIEDNVPGFGGLHFFNPVPMMKLLEVVRHDSTTDKVFNRLTGFGKAIGKTCVTCKDTPGFIVNRLLVPYLFESMRLAERGEANIRDVDIAMKLGAGYPMGPFELCDYIGLDTIKFIMDGWTEEYPNEPAFAPSKLLDSMIAEGKFGRKTGQGFYEYSKK